MKFTPIKSDKAAYDAGFGNTNDPRGAFNDLLLSQGYKPNGVEHGRIVRIDGPEDKHGKKSGWYVYHEFNVENGHIGIGSYGSWKTGQKETWCSRSQNIMTVQERMEYQRYLDVMRIERETAQTALWEEAKARAGEMYRTGYMADPRHAYFAAKGISPCAGIKQVDDNLIIPITINGEITSLQYIRPDGSKKFMFGGKVQGGYYMIPGQTDIVYVAEGYATAKTVHDATGKKCYVAFNAGNLYEVASTARNENITSKIIIAGDDDQFTVGNPGKTKATQAAEGIGVDAVFPVFSSLETKPTDFNDMAKLDGIKAVQCALMPRKIDVYQKEEDHDIAPPLGILRDIFDYYNATSGNKQTGFAIQTALAIGSIVCSRNFRTNFDNYPSLFLLNVGKSSTGKEHAKTVIERILHDAGVGDLIAGDGYTSAGAVFSALLDKPKHISVIDEFGRYLEAGNNLKTGSHNQREANTKLMESIGRAHTVMRPPSYSTMTLKKDQADAIKNRLVHNPAITLLTMTTPDTLFKTLDMGAIKDGFINRFIISISDAERAIRQHKPPIKVPQSIVSWISSISVRGAVLSSAAEPANPVTLVFSQEAIDAQLAFQQYCVDTANELDKFGMAELTGRANEMAMRISLIVALSKNPDAHYIENADMEWSIMYVKSCLDKTIDRLKMTISSSPFESAKKEILTDLRKRGADGMTWAQMQKNAPYSQHKPKDLREILNSLKEADLAADEPATTAKGGRPTMKWFATA